MRGARGFILSVFVGLTIAACGGGGTKTAPPAATDATDSTESESSGEKSSVAVNKSFFFAGFKVAVEQAELDPTAGTDGELTITAKLTNNGDENARFDDVTMVVSSNGSDFEVTGFGDDPDVPGASTGKGTFVFPVDQDFTLADAVLTVGRSSNNQAVVPLGSKGKLVDLAPKPVTVTGQAVAEEVQVDVSGGELRADVPQDHKQIEAGHLALTLDFQATFNSDFAGGYAFTGNNLALKLPDGTTISPDEGPIELIAPRATLRDVKVRFIIDDPVAGTYALVAIQDVGTPTRGEFTFTLT